MKKKQTVRRKQKKAVFSEEEVKSLTRSVSFDRAFRFFEEIGKPTGHVAVSLLEFYNIIESAESDRLKLSLVFHQKRGDFSNWIKKVVGDKKLAAEISRIKPSDVRLKKKLVKTVDARIVRLREALMTFTVVPEEGVEWQIIRSRS